MVDKLFEYVWLFCSAFLSVLLVYYLATSVSNSSTDCLQYSAITGKKTMHTDGKCYEYVNGRFKVVNFDELLNVAED